MGVVVLIGLAVTGVALFAGGVRVMNIMSVCVTERAREIGGRGAIGARRRWILARFLFGSVTICLLGGVVGIALPIGVAAAIKRFLMPPSSCRLSGRSSRRVG